MIPITVEEVAEIILSKRSQDSTFQTLLVGVSGIDGSGKGFITEKIVTDLERAGQKCAGITIDGWLNLPKVRFNDENPAEHFYNPAIRFEEMFSELILPLKRDGSIDRIADYTEEIEGEYRKHRYQYKERIDVIVLEGIYLFKKSFRKHFDITIWIDCSFETALERAVQRAQEGLSPAETMEAYRRIYFPAQEIHFAMDNPRGHSEFLIQNDWRPRDAW